MARLFQEALAFVPRSHMGGMKLRHTCAHYGACGWHKSTGWGTGTEHCFQGHTQVLFCVICYCGISA